MSLSPDRTPLFGIPYGLTLDQAASSRYRYESYRRGKIPFVILQVTLSGEGQFTWNGTTQSVPTGHAFIARIPEKSCYTYPANGTEVWRFCWINLYGQSALEYGSHIREKFGTVFPLDIQSGAGRELKALIARAEKKDFQDRFEASILCYQFIVRLWRQLSRPREATHDVVAWAMDHMRHHALLDFSVKELATNAEMSREHFTRIFKEKTGRSPAEFLRSVRIKQALELMTTTSLPLHEIARRSGFASLGHLRSAHLSITGQRLQRKVITDL